MLEVIATVNDFTQDGINYKVTGSDKKQVHIVGYESSVAADIELPLTVKYENKIYTLTGIDENAFKDCAKLASIFQWCDNAEADRLAQETEREHFRDVHR